MNTSPFPCAFTRARPAVAAACLVAALAGSAAGQCQNWYNYDIPDLDQRRTALPANGGMYCAPTSAVNIFAYYANNGVQQANTLDGPHDWEDQANYDRVTNVLALMGGLMGTDPQKGTKGGMIPGAAFYAGIAAPAQDIVVCGATVWGGGLVPSPKRFNDAHTLGAMIAAAYGFYTKTNGGIRSGGHVITINGMTNCTSPLPPIMHFRDPAFDSPANALQSDFRTSMAVLTPVTGVFQPSDSALPVPLTMYRMDITAASKNFLDCWYLFYPASAVLVPPALDANEIKVVRPFRPTGNPMPEIQSFSKAAGTGAIQAIVVAPDHLNYYYACGVGTPEKPNIWKLNAVTGQSTKMTSAAFNPTGLALSRFRDMYSVEGTSVVRYTLNETGEATKVKELTLSLNPEAIAYDDATDRVIAISIPSGVQLRKVTAMGRSLPSFTISWLLGVNVKGKASIVPDPENSKAFWVCGDESTTVYRVEEDAVSGNLEITDSITHPAGSVIGGLNMTDSKTLVYSVNDKLVEKVKQGNSWVNKANSRWAGRPSSRFLNLSRSRDNFDEAVMNDPAFNNLEKPTEYPSYGDCYADCDGDGELSINDFICFQTLFALDDLTADCDFDGKRTIDDFICFQTAFAIGC